MIARVWQGWTHTASADDYLSFLKETVVAELQTLRGFRGIRIFRTEENDHVRYLVYSLWDSFDSIRAFAGDDIEKARIYPGTLDYFVKYDQQVSHMDVVYYQ